MGIFSFKNKENKGPFKTYEGLAPKRPSTTHDQFKTTFWKKMINSLVTKLINSEQQNTLPAEEIKLHDQITPIQHVDISPIINRIVFLPSNSSAPRSPYIVTDAAYLESPNLSRENESSYAQLSNLSSPSLLDFHQKYHPIDLKQKPEEDKKKTEIKEKVPLQPKQLVCKKTGPRLQVKSIVVGSVEEGFTQAKTKEKSLVNICASSSQWEMKRAIRAVTSTVSANISKM